MVFNVSYSKLLFYIILLKLIFQFKFMIYFQLLVTLGEKMIYYVRKVPFPHLLGK